MKINYIKVFEKILDFAQQFNLQSNKDHNVNLLEPLSKFNFI